MPFSLLGAMTTLMIAFVAAFLSEIGGAMPALVAKLDLRFGGRARLVVALAAITGLLAVVSATIGQWLGVHMSDYPRLLFFALSLMTAGGTMLGRARGPRLRGERFGWPVAAPLSFLLAGWSSNAQFIVTGAAVRYGELWFAAIGGLAGVVLATAPAMALGPDYAQARWPRPARLTAAILLISTGIVTAAHALAVV